MSALSAAQKAQLERAKEANRYTFYQTHWRPGLIGRIGRVIFGLLLYLTVTWITTDPYCLLYWIFGGLSFLLIAPLLRTALKTQKRRFDGSPLDRQFEDYLPTIAAVSLTLWGAILDGIIWKELFLFFWVIDLVMTSVLSVWGICHILAAIFGITGSSLNAVQYILSVYVTRNPKDYAPEPPIVCGPVYWLNAFEIKFTGNVSKTKDKD